MCGDVTRNTFFQTAARLSIFSSRCKTLFHKKSFNVFFLVFVLVALSSVVRLTVADYFGFSLSNFSRISFYSNFTAFFFFLFLSQKMINYNPSDQTAGDESRRAQTATKFFSELTCVGDEENAFIASPLSLAFVLFERLAHCRWTSVELQATYVFSKNQKFFVKFRASNLNTTTCWAEFLGEEKETIWRCCGGVHDSSWQLLYTLRCLSNKCVNYINIPVNDSCFLICFICILFGDPETFSVIRGASKY